MAGLLWLHERALKISETLSEGVSKDPQFCYEAGLCWDDLLFDLTDSLILQGLEGSLIYQLKALNEWDPKRSDKVRNLLPQDVLNFYESLENYHQEFVEFAEALKVPVLMKLSTAEFYSSAEAYNSMLAYNKAINDLTATGNIQTQIEVSDYFFRNLRLAINDNCVEAFAKNCSELFKRDPMGNPLTQYGLTDASLN